MKKLKNLILVVLVLFVGLGFCACKDTGNSGNNNSGNNSGGNNAGNTKQTYTITYLETKGMANSNPTTYTEDTETIILKDLEDADDYEFLGWYNGETKITEIKKGTNGNLTLTAKWSSDMRLSYILRQGYYEVSGIGLCECTDIVIPETYNGIPVMVIGAEAFKKNQNITSIVLGNNITNISYGAFYGCNSLLSITIGSNVTYIGENAFIGCLKLVEVYNLSSLTINKGSSDYGDVGYYAKDVYISLNEPSKLKTSNGVIYYVNDTEKSAIKPVDINASSIVLDNDCTEIKADAFRNCRSLTSITIGDSVTSIGFYAFSGCISLTEVTIPSSVTYIGLYAFDSCSNLTNVTFEDTNGWTVDDYGDEIHSLSSEKLSNGSIAAGYLNLLYCNCNWKKV